MSMELIDLWDSVQVVDRILVLGIGGPGGRQSDFSIVSA